MNSSSGGVGGSGDKDDGSASNGNLHDHSDLLIPNPSFLASPASSTSSSVMNMNITSPCSSDTDLASKCQMEVQMASPQEPMSCEASAAMDFISSINNHNSQPDSSPPNVIVDDSPLQPCMDRNKESLKNKLLMRRSMNQLVEQGILPPPKTPAAFANQRVRLERARMGDLLKAKIQQRPARQELVRQHILEDTDTRVAPLLAEKQRMLKRAKLADSLNDHLIHRPGPLELVQKNILHAPDADIEKAIKEGIVSFKATSEGHVPGPSLPNKYTIINEDDSSSDISSPAGTPDACSSGATTEANTPIPKQLSDSAINNLSPLSVPPTPPTSQEQPCQVTLQPAKSNKSESASTSLHQQPSLILTATIPPVAPVQPKLTSAPISTTIFQVTTPTAVIPPPPPLPPSFAPTSVGSIPPPPPPLPPQTIVLTDGAVRELLPQLQAGFQLAAAHVQKPSQSSSLGKSRSSKKSSKSKSQPKARTIKFHEYKGPSNLQQKGGSSANSLGTSSGAQTKVETSYELLLKQQQLLLQWQLELQHKYPQIILPAAPKDAQVSATSCSKTMSSFPVTTIPASLCTNLINNQQTSSQQPTATIAVATASTNASLKPIPVTLAPKLAEIAPKPPAPTLEVSTSISESKTTPLSGEIPSVPSPATSTTSSVSDTSKSLKPLNLSNINEWKVNDLKAELKKRSLPVSGSKSQLMERLKIAVAKEGGSNEKSSVSVKMEVVTATDENSSEGMDVTFSNNDDIGCGGSNNNKSTAKISQPQSRPPAAVPTPTTVVIGTPSNNTENNNISILDLASGKLNGVQIPLQNILSLLGVSATVSNDGTNGFVFGNNNPTADNNVKNATITSTIPTPIVQSASNNAAKVIGQLPISAVVATATKLNESSSNSNNKLIDENKILEQQEQILQLRKALELSQQQLQQLAQQKDPKNGGSQKHRLVLQQHIQQKRHQQAIQNHLQSLIQLQSQQAEQKKQQQLLQQQQQAQAQLVLISSNNNNQPVSIANNILPVTIVSSSPSPAGITHNWLHPQHNGNSTAEKPERQQEVMQTRVEPGANLNFEDLVQTMNTKHIPKLESAGSDSGKGSVKSQMVDDVLEILIRNGELPPSAAQDPHTKTLSPPSATGGNTTNQNLVTGQPIPPPPPLPPQGFSVMLPTSIPFSRHQTTTNTITTDFLSTFGEADNLSKDAQAILKITEDLTKFGKSREAEAAAAAAANAVSRRFENGTGSSGNLTMMDCGFFNGSSDSKDFDLSSSTADSMDVGFGDAHSVSLHSSSSTGSSSNNKHQSINNLFNNSFDSGTFSFGQQQHQQPQQQMKAIKGSLHNSGEQHQQQNHFMSDEDLVSLDMQMDTDYSDWLDTFLPAAESSSTHNSGNGMVPNLFPMEHQGKSTSGKRPDSDSLHNNDNNNVSNANSSDSNGTPNNIFGSLLEDHLNSALQQGQQRDPLLSSRSFTPSRMTTMTLPFGEVQPNNVLFAHQHHLNNSNPGATTALLFHTIPTSSASSATATLMDTDFDELTVMPSSGSSCSNTKLIKSENNLILNSANTNVITEMPSTNPTPITTTSINDNFLWDFAM